jgi:hypothetical protein
MPYLRVPPVQRVISQSNHLMRLRKRWELSHLTPFWPTQTRASLVAWKHRCAAKCLLEPLGQPGGTWREVLGLMAYLEPRG